MNPWTFIAKLSALSTSPFQGTSRTERTDVCGFVLHSTNQLVLSSVLMGFQLYPRNRREMKEIGIEPESPVGRICKLSAAIVGTRMNLHKFHLAS